MSHEHRTPVVPARSLTPQAATHGDRIAVTLDGQGTYPFEIDDTHHDGDQIRLHLTELGGDHRRVDVLVHPDQPLAALATHYGLCADCGRLSPCPDELAERRLEKLWHDPHADLEPPPQAQSTHVDDPHALTH